MTYKTGDDRGRGISLMPLKNVSKTEFCLIILIINTEERIGYEKEVVFDDSRAVLYVVARGDCSRLRG